jgi:flavin-dependent dehydrogenase
MYDVIVIGARCAGSPLSMLLAQHGYRVLLLDKASFPSDTMSTHIVWHAGASRLARWGLLDAVAASGCPPFESLRLTIESVELKRVPPAVDGTTAGYCPRRIVLDKILLDAAVAAGAEFRDRFSAEALVFDGEEVVGVRGRSRGAQVEERARIVVGADGMHSLVAREAAAPSYDTQPPLACWYYTYFSGVPVGGQEFWAQGRRVFNAVPTNEGKTLVGVGWPNAEFAAFRADIERNFYETLALSREFCDRVKQGVREEKFVGTADLPSFFRKPYGPGWALVGDAGYHKDPITAQGISDAFRDAELLATAIHSGFTGGRVAQRCPRCLRTPAQRNGWRHVRIHLPVCANRAAESGPHAGDDGVAG